MCSIMYCDGTICKRKFLLLLLLLLSMSGFILERVRPEAKVAEKQMKNEHRLEQSGATFLLRLLEKQPHNECLALKSPLCSKTKF